MRNRREIWRVDYPQLNRMEQVVAGEAQVAMESLDGHSLYFAKHSEVEGVWLQTLPHGQAQQVVSKLYRRNLFAPARNGLFYIAGTKDGPNHIALFFRSERDGTVKRIHTFEHDIFWGLDLSRDERSIFFSQFEVNNADIMLVENFH